MKKLFLTSGIIACMACPAFADPAFTASQGSGATEQARTVAEACQYDPLQTYSGTSNLVAVWTADSHTLTLKNNTGLGTSADGTLYTVYDTGAYTDSNRQNLMTSSTYPVTPIPTGAQVTMDYALRTPFNPATNESYASIMQDEPIAVTQNRTFTGYYDTVDNDGKAITTGQNQSVMYINNEGYITSTGTDRAADLINDSEIWNAGWTCTNFAVPSAPSVYGYTFGGWQDETGAAIEPDQSGNICLYDNTTLYTNWTAKTWTVQYSCGEGATGTNHPANQTATYDTEFTFQGNTDATQCQKNGSHFVGWYCDNGVSASDTAAGWHSTTESSTGVHTGDTVTYWQYQNLADNATITCTARYAPNTLTLTYDEAGGSAVADGTCSYGGDVVLPANPTKTGYTFGGWNVSSASENNALVQQQQQQPQQPQP